ncbi:MAG: hypothetical protein QM534_17275 [Sediminibacterium sp.]|nr:hypothetical protein [Sediminibacterium sp.]
MSFYSGSPVSFVFGIVMMLVVVVLGFTVLFTDWKDDVLFGWKRHLFVFMMFTYAIYRGIRVYQLYKANRKNTA